MVSRVNRRSALPVLLCTLTLVVGGGCAARQPARSFLDLQQRLHSGNTVYVIDNTGSERKGKIVDVSPSALVLDVNGIRRRMEQDSVRQVQRFGDSLWNGLLIGVAVGTPGMLIADPTYERCKNDPQKLCANLQTGQRVVALGIMGAVGAGIDALIRGRNQVYLAPGQTLQSATGAQAVAGSFEELQVRVKIGDTVYVIDGSGQETKGRVGLLSAASLQLTLNGNRRDFPESDVTRIERRRRDSVRNGVLIGIGSGAGLGFLIGRTADSPSCPQSGIECGQGALLGTIGGAFWGGVAGWITDALIRKREVIYLAPGRP
jgi:ribosomal protein L24